MKSVFKNFPTGFDFGNRLYAEGKFDSIGLYGMGGRLGGTFCSYTEAMVATDRSGDTDSYSHDAVWVTTPYVGGGVSFDVGSEVRLGVNAPIGYRIIGERTWHDLDPGISCSYWFLAFSKAAESAGSAAIL